MRVPRGTGWRSSCRSFRSPAALVPLVILLITSGCNDLQAPAPNGSAQTTGHYANGSLELVLTTGAGEVSPLTLLATDLHYDAAAQQLHAKVALRNGSPTPIPGPDHIAVSGFRPAEVRPVNASCGSAALECAFDHHGTYGADGVLAPGETSTPVEWILRDPAGQSFAFNARIAELVQNPGTIRGIVFEDRNGDGLRDPGELGLEDARVRLRFGAETAVHSTDPRGFYGFQVESPGIYQLDVEPRTGWHPTTALPLQVTLVLLPDSTISTFAAGDIGLARDAGGNDSLATVTIEGFVFEDSNRNGQRDAGEPPIVNVKIKGKGCDHDEDDGDDDSGPVVSVKGVRLIAGDDDGDSGDDPGDDGDDVSVRSDSLGHYALVVRGCGTTWKVSGASLRDFDRTTPKTVTFSAPPPAGETLHADFGYARQDVSRHYEVRGTVFLDLNRNGVRELGEPGIEGVGMSASGIACAGPTAAIDRTDARGRYELDGGDVRCPLPWTVQCAALPGTIATTPDSVRLDAPPAIGSKYTVDFGLAPDDTAGPLPSYVIEGSVFLDVNRSGLRDAGEPGVAGAQVFLLGPCSEVRGATTDPDGHYHFDADVVGHCAVTTVWQALPDFDKHTTPNPVRVDPAGPASGGLTIDFGVRVHD